MTQRQQPQTTVIIVMITNHEIFDAVGVHVDLSLFPVTLAGQSVLPGNVSRDCVRLGQKFTVKLQNGYLAERHIYNIELN